MTDYLSRFGAVTAAGSDNVLDFGGIDGRAAMQSHRTGEQHDATVVFRAGADVAATVTVTVKLQDSADNSAFTDLASGQPVAGIKAGEFAFLPFPLIHKRYVRAVVTGANSSGAVAVPGVSAYIESGPRKPEK
jgi:hypothetical protein